MCTLVPCVRCVLNSCSGNTTLHSCKLKLTVLRSSAPLQLIALQQCPKKLKTACPHSKQLPTNLWERFRRALRRLAVSKNCGSVNQIGSHTVIPPWVTQNLFQYTNTFSADSPKYSYVLIRYRDESLSLIGMHNSCHSNRNLDTERVTGSIDNSQRLGDKERRRDEMVSQRRAGNLRSGVLLLFFPTQSDVETCRRVQPGARLIM